MNRRKDLNLTNNQYVPLHVHSHFSFLDGLASVDDIVSRAQEIGAPAIALTDHGNMHGAAKFYHTAKSKGIKPIIGCEMYFSLDGRLIKERDKYGKPYYHLIVLAKNNKGLENLYQLNGISWEEKSYYYKPRIDFEVLEEYAEGLIVTSACIGGPTIQMLLKDSYEKSKQVTQKFVDIFGDDFYIELQDHGLPEQKETNPLLMKMAKELGVKTIITNDSHYARKEDAEYQDVLLAISQNKPLNDPDRMRFENNEFYIKSLEELKEVFKEKKYDESLANTLEIADKCNVDMDVHDHYLPKVQVPEGFKDNKEYFEAVCRQGIEDLFEEGTWTEEYEKQLQYELEVIDSMGFNDYFLIVSDFIRWAKENDISIGPGRGSAAGSLAAYVSKITSIDPIESGLYFERFLNPERVELPDVDIDIEQERRQDVAEYLRKKYGYANTANIATITLLKAKNALADVMRVFEIEAQESLKVTKMIPDDMADLSLKELYNSLPEFRDKIDSNETFKNVFDIASRLLGTPRNTGIHAAGLIIADNPITNYAPVFETDDKKTGLRTKVCQFEKKMAEKSGLVKMDLLGLQTLDIIKKTQTAINKNRSADNQFDIEKIPLDDPNVYEVFARGDTTNVFQFESDGMKSSLKKLHPEKMVDLIAMNALYRPGPIAYIDEYIQNKYNPSQIKYEHPLLKPILEETYGIITFQEQVMKIFQELAGFPLGRADLVRRAIGKKDKATMEQELKILKEGNEELGIVGARANGVPDDVTDSVIKKIETFAEYAFNKAHAACYSNLAYKTAYLKHYYPAEFMAANLTLALNNAKDLKKYIGITKSAMKIKILPPDINKSTRDFEKTDDGIVVSLQGIDGIGEKAARKIVQEREENGLFKNLEDFCFRMFSNGVGKGNVKVLVESGAFDFTSLTRNTMLSQISMYEEAYKSLDMGSFNAGSLFNLTTEKSVFELFYSQEDLNPHLEDSPKEIVLWEKKNLKILLTYNPLDDYMGTISVPYVHTVESLEAEFIKGNIQEKQKVLLIGMAGEYEELLAKSGNRYARIAFEGTESTVELMVFKKQLEEIRGSFMTTKTNEVCLIFAEVNNDERFSINLKKYFPAGSFALITKEEANNRLIRLLSDKELRAAKKYGSERRIETIQQSHHDIYVLLDFEQNDSYFKEDGSETSLLNQKISSVYAKLYSYSNGHSSVYLCYPNGKTKKMCGISVVGDDAVLDLIKKELGVSKVLTR